MHIVCILNIILKHETINIIFIQANTVALDERMGIVMDMARTCQKQEKSTDADLNELMKYEMPSTHSAKCLHACLLESVGLLVDGKPSVENAVHLARFASKNDPEMVKLTREIATECESTTDPDRCEMAYKMIKCSLQASIKRGFDPKKLFS